jgi:hypothetical protein
MADVAPEDALHFLLRLFYVLRLWKRCGAPAAVETQRVIQSISGHSSFEMLQRYLDVKDEQKRQAALAFD